MPEEWGSGRRTCPAALAMKTLRCRSMQVAQSTRAATSASEMYCIRVIGRCQKSGAAIKRGKEQE